MIALENITKKYEDGGSIKTVLSDIDFEINEGELVAIMGKSGSGKTTLLKIIGGLIKANKGRYYFNDNNISQYSFEELENFRFENIGFIYQNSPLIETKNVYDNIALPLQYKKIESKKIKKKVNYWLDKLEINKLKKQMPYTLSGGEKQRVCIARALVMNPKLILADEPTGSLDEKTEQTILEVFKDLNTKKRTIIIVTHDNEVAGICEKKYFISNGKVQIIN